MLHANHREIDLRILITDEGERYLNLYKDVFSPDQNFFCDMYLNGDEVEQEGSKEFFTRYKFDFTYCNKRHNIVENVRKAIDEGNPYAVAFLDIRIPFPEEDIHVGEKIRRLDPHIELVYVTSHGDYNPEEIVSRIPPVHKLLFIQKPFSVHEMFHFAHALGCKWYHEEYSRTLKVNLEALVEKKTKALKQANETLENKVKERTLHLEEANTAVKVLLEYREKDKEILGATFLNNIQQIIIPLIERLRSTKISARQKKIIETVESSLKEITSPFINNLGIKFFNLTSMELQVVNLVKSGLSNTEISDILGVSTGTIRSHRHNIRGKLNIKNKNINLRKYLLSLE